MSVGVPKPFLDYIVAHPDENTPRLAYADWLEENGDTDRAEFIRVQVARASVPTWDASQVSLRLREQALLAQHGERWLAELPVIPGARWEGFRRGIVAEVSFTNFDAMRSNAHACRAVAPVEAVTVRWPRRREASTKDVEPIAELRELFVTGRPQSEVEIQRLAESPQLSTLHSLTCRGVWAAEIDQLVGSPHLTKLRCFRLPANSLGDEGVEALVASAQLAALEELDLSGEGVSDRYDDDPTVELPGMSTLTAWPGLKNVRRLTLNQNQIGQAGLRQLLRSPNAVGIKHLVLRSITRQASAIAEFASAHPDLRLETLDLGDNVLGEAGMKAFAEANCLSELTELRLDRCGLSWYVVRALAESGRFFRTVRSLDLSHNNLGSTTLEILLDRRPPVLHTLYLRNTDLQNGGVKMLAEHPGTNTLLDLDISQNGLTAAAGYALEDTTELRSLLRLAAADNPWKMPATQAALQASPLGQRLTSLDFDTPVVPNDDDD